MSKIRKMCLTCKHVECIDLNHYCCTHVCRLTNEIVSPHEQACEKYERKEEASRDSVR